MLINNMNVNSITVNIIKMMTTQFLIQSKNTLDVKTSTILNINNHKMAFSTFFQSQRFKKMMKAPKVNFYRDARKRPMKVVNNIYYKSFT